jgi:hydrogenase expression/formation protein HypC
MCLAIPALIMSIEGSTARAEVGGVERTVSLALTPEAQVGDYVLLHTGFAIGVVDEEEAQETLRLIEELAEFYADEADVDRASVPDRLRSAASADSAETGQVAGSGPDA